MGPVKSRSMTGCCGRVASVLVPLAHGLAGGTLTGVGDGDAGGAGGSAFHKTERTRVA